MKKSILFCSMSIWLSLFAVPEIAEEPIQESPIEENQNERFKHPLEEGQPLQGNTSHIPSTVSTTQSLKDGPTLQSNTAPTFESTDSHPQTPQKPASVIDSQSDMPTTEQQPPVMQLPDANNPSVIDDLRHTLLGDTPSKDPATATPTPRESDAPVQKEPTHTNAVASTQEDEEDEPVWANVIGSSNTLVLNKETPITESDVKDIIEKLEDDYKKIEPESLQKIKESRIMQDALLGSDEYPNIARKLYPSVNDKYRYIQSKLHEISYKVVDQGESLEEKQRKIFLNQLISCSKKLLDDVAKNPSKQGNFRALDALSFLSNPPKELIYPKDPKTGKLLLSDPSPDALSLTDPYLAYFNKLAGRELNLDFTDRENIFRYFFDHPEALYPKKSIFTRIKEKIASFFTRKKPITKTVLDDLEEDPLIFYTQAKANITDIAKRFQDPSANKSDTLQELGSSLQRLASAQEILSDPLTFVYKDAQGQTRNLSEAVEQYRAQKQEFLLGYDGLDDSFYEVVGQRLLQNVTFPTQLKDITGFSDFEEEQKKLLCKKYGLQNDASLKDIGKAYYDEVSSSHMSLEDIGILSAPRNKDIPFRDLSMFNNPELIDAYENHIDGKRRILCKPFANFMFQDFSEFRTSLIEQVNASLESSTSYATSGDQTVQDIDAQKESIDQLLKQYKTLKINPDKVQNIGQKRSELFKKDTLTETEKNILTSVDQYISTIKQADISEKEKVSRLKELKKTLNSKKSGDTFVASQNINRSIESALQEVSKDYETSGVRFGGSEVVYDGTQNSDMPKGDQLNDQSDNQQTNTRLRRINVKIENTNVEVRVESSLNEEQIQEVKNILNEVSKFDQKVPQLNISSLSEIQSFADQLVTFHSELLPYADKSGQGVASVVDISAFPNINNALKSIREKIGQYYDHDENNITIYTGPKKDFETINSIVSTFAKINEVMVMSSPNMSFVGLTSFKNANTRYHKAQRISTK